MSGCRVLAKPRNDGLRRLTANISEIFLESRSCKCRTRNGLWISVALTRRWMLARLVVNELAIWVVVAVWQVRVAAPPIDRLQSARKSGARFLKIIGGLKGGKNGEDRLGLGF